MKRKVIRLLVVLLLIAGASYGIYRWKQSQKHGPLTSVVLYGNMDERDVQLAFKESGRITRELVHEGATVRKGELVATLDTDWLIHQAAEAKAVLAAQKQVWLRLKRGSRPQEIAMDRALYAAAAAKAANDLVNVKRYEKLLATGDITQIQYDNEKALWKVDNQQAHAAKETLRLAVLGPRVEDIAEAAAKLQADKAQLALLEQYLADTYLKSPVNGVVRTRILEPGDMASPQTPVYTIAIMNPKWVRAYIPERDLGFVHGGSKAWITVDSFPGKKFAGWVGFISPIAEFTPKSVETTQLRTSLVYEVRVYVKDPHDQLRLGMPATVEIPITPQPIPLRKARH
ncbi:MAG: efflux RND transporter periplasmic adaptor subunit [Phycisphaerae bacterium]